LISSEIVIFTKYHEFGQLDSTTQEICKIPDGELNP